MMFILLAQATEPTDCRFFEVCELNEAEATTVNEVIDWLKANAGGEWGGCLCEWELTPTKLTGDGAAFVGLDAVLGWIKLNSRYNETDIPGDFYNARNAHLDRVPSAM